MNPSTAGDSGTQMTPARVLGDEEDCILYAMQLASGAELAMVLKTALELDLLEIITEAGPGARISPVEAAGRLAAKNPDAPAMLDRMMRLLTTYSVLTCEEHEQPDGRVERLYGLAPVSKYLTRNEEGASVASMCLMNHDKVSMASWNYLKDAILEGGVPFEKAHGMTAFEYPGTDTRFNNVFNRAMHDTSIFTMKKILDTYNGCDGLKSLVDVGGGVGGNLNVIVSKYPSIRGINYDLSHVITVAPSYPGVEHIRGDMFVSVPKADAIFMKSILHDWSDQHCLKILKNCYEALPLDGKMIVCENLLPQRLDTGLATKVVVHMDMLMLAYNPGGRERTKKEFEVLAMAAGFKGFRIACSIFGTYVMEFLKN